MLSDERFVFSLAGTGAEVLDDPLNDTSHPPPASELAQLLTKWGLSFSGERNTGGLIQRYQYHIAKGEEQQPRSAANGSPADTATSATAVTRGPSVAASALRFHDGLVADFLNALFTDATLQAALKVANGKVRLPQPSGRNGSLTTTTPSACLVHYEKLTCRWTDLMPVSAPLINAGVVRRTGSTADGDNLVAAVHPMPAMKRMEELLPGDVVIADEVRALFLLAHHRRRCPGTGGYSGGGGDDDYAVGEERVEDGESEEEEEDDADLYGYHEGAKLSRRALRAVFSAADRREFLYHIVWRLVAGGGAMNQFEDDFHVYKAAARDLYRALVTSLAVKRVLVEKSAGSMEQIDETPGETEKEARFVPEVTSLVFRVTGCRPSPHGEKEGELTLFPCHDGVRPSNLNYCYVIVNPTQQSVVVWYHSCV